MEARVTVGRTWRSTSCKRDLLVVRRLVCYRGSPIVATKQPKLRGVFRCSRGSWSGAFCRSGFPVAEPDHRSGCGGQLVTTPGEWSFGIWTIVFVSGASARALDLPSGFATRSCRAVPAELGQIRDVVVWLDGHFRRRFSRSDEHCFVMVAMDAPTAWFVETLFSLSLLRAWLQSHSNTAMAGENFKPVSHTAHTDCMHKYGLLRANCGSVSHTMPVSQSLLRLARTTT